MSQEHFKDLLKMSLPDLVLIWNLYIDDVFVEVDGNLNHILTLINSDNTNNQFTIEHPNDNSYIPFLDTVIYVSSNNINTRHYIKEIHSKHILPWNSA